MTEYQLRHFVWPTAPEGVQVWTVTDTYGGSHCFDCGSAAKSFYDDYQLRSDLEGHTITLTSPNGEVWCEKSN